MMFQSLLNLLSRWFRREFTRSLHNKENSDLKKFFTDNDYACNAFEEIISKEPFSQHFLVIYGIGSVGKSTLLMMYHLTCFQRHIPIALVRGEEAKSVLDVLSTWASELKSHNISLPTFQSSLAHYRLLERKVETSVREVSRTAKVSKGAAGTIVRAAASTIPIPIVNSLVGDLGTAAVETIANHLHNSFSKTDLDFYLDPTEHLTNDFLHDLGQITAHHSLVLMIDTFEQMTTLDDWVRNVAKRLPEHILLVLAGREVPQWNRAWPEWRGKAKIVELKEMSSDDVGLLVQRYYTYVGGENKLDTQVVEDIVRLARGLPMIATSAVDSLVYDGVQDFQTMQSRVLPELVDRFLEGTSQDMRPAFEVAAILRYFNAEVLQALTHSDDADELYAKLRQRRSFIHPRNEGRAVHDTMRELLNKTLRLNKPDRFHALHGQAASFYEERLVHARGEERERLILERTYHRMLADEKSGIQLFQETAEELVLYHFIVRLRTLLKDIETYKRELDSESLLWVMYYNGRLLYLEGKWEEAEHIYEQIERRQAEPKLHAYVLCDHGHILSQLEWRRREGSSQRAIELIQQAFDHFPIDKKVVLGHKSLSAVYEFQGNMQKAELHLQQMLQFYQEQRDAIGVANVCFDLRWHYMLRGNWKKMLEAHKIGVESITPFLDISPAWKEEALRVNWGHIWMGRYREYGDNHRRISEEVLPQMVDQFVKSECLYRLGVGEGMQGKFDEAHRHFSESYAIQQELGLDQRKDFQGVFRGFWGAMYTRQGKFVEAEQYLEEALAIKQEAQDTLGIPEVLLWLGELAEIRQHWDKAEGYYRQCLEDYKVDRSYFDCYALTGMVRVRYSQKQNNLIASLLEQAELLAQRNEYNDHLASLRLIQGHIAWDDQRFGSALHYYQQALVYALRYNRFLLDDVLGGNIRGTTFLPIISFCLKRGEEGQRMLFELHTWWRNGRNDVGLLVPAKDSISLIPNSVLLIEGERLARLQEPGDGKPQSTVLEQIDKMYRQG